MSKKFIALIVKDENDKKILFEDVFYDSIKRYINSDTSILIISNKVFTVKYFKQQSFFLKINLSNIKKSFHRNFYFMLNTIIEFGLYEYANFIKIYKSINEVINDNFYEISLYPQKLPLRIIYNPIDFFGKKEEKFFLDLGQYFNLIINKNFLLANYKNTRLQYHPTLNQDYLDQFKTNVTYFYWSISSRKFLFFSKRKHSDFSLKYITLRRFFSLSDYISIKLYLLIPFKLKEFIKYIAQKIYYRNQRVFNANEFIVTSSFRKKLLFFKYFLAFSKEVSKEVDNEVLDFFAFSKRVSKDIDNKVLDIEK